GHSSSERGANSGGPHRTRILPAAPARPGADASPAGSCERRLPARRPRPARTPRARARRARRSAYRRRRRSSGDRLLEGRGERVDLGLRALLGHGDQQAIAEAPIEALERHAGQEALPGEPPRYALRRLWKLQRELLEEG